MNITRDDLCVDLEGPPDCGHESCMESRETTVRPVTDEEFDRLAQEAGYVKAHIRGQRYVVGSSRSKALRALLTDECEPCKGTGQFLTYGVPCNVCDGRGWIPKEGVYIEWNCDAPSYAKQHGGCNPGDDFYPHRHTLCRYQVEFPLDWLEADDE